MSIIHILQETVCVTLASVVNIKYITIRPRRSWEYNIKMDPREIGWGGMDWINLAEDKDQWRALVNMVTNFWIL
jgi:hypothetical protein